MTDDIQTSNDVLRVMNILYNNETECPECDSKLYNDEVNRALWCETCKKFWVKNEKGSE